MVKSKKFSDIKKLSAISYLLSAISYQFLIQLPASIVFFLA